jgi:hypothetical protein
MHPIADPRMDASAAAVWNLHEKYTLRWRACQHHKIVYVERKIDALQESPATAAAVQRAEEVASAFMQQDDVVSEALQDLIWINGSDQTRDLAWLLEAGFHRRTTHEHTWSQNDVQALLKALRRLHEGTLLKASPTMRLAYFLSHHVMLKKYSEQACAKMVYRLRDSIMRQNRGAAPAPEREEECGTDPRNASDDSADEADLGVLSRSRRFFEGQDYE